MKEWHKLKPELFKKQPYYLPGCDSYGPWLLVADRKTDIALGLVGLFYPTDWPEPEITVCAVPAPLRFRLRPGARARVPDGFGA